MKTFKMLEVKKEWQSLFPELNGPAINQCVLAEKKEWAKKDDEAEAHLLKAIAIHEGEEIWRICSN